MRVIGVIDVRGAQAVHARAGQRDQYKPIGDAVELARTYVDRHGIAELYVADLDAIVGISDDRDPERVALHADVARPAQLPDVARPAPLADVARPAPLADVARPFQGRDESIAIRTICGLAPTWLDAAVSSIERAQRTLALGAAHVIVGLETLPSFDILRAICNHVGGKNVAFSLDLRDGRPMGIAQDERPHFVAARAADRGAEAIIVIDVARVGTGAGIDLDLIARVRDAAPGVTLLAGGGIRGREDLEALAAAGCDGALVATMLQSDAIDR